MKMSHLLRKVKGDGKKKLRENQIFQLLFSQYLMIKLRYLIQRNIRMSHQNMEKSTIKT